MKHYFYDALYDRVLFFAKTHKHYSLFSEICFETIADKLAVRSDVRLAVEISHLKYALEFGSTTNMELTDVLDMIIKNGHCDHFLENIINTELSHFISNRIRNELRN